MPMPEGVTPITIRDLDPDGASACAPSAFSLGSAEALEALDVLQARIPGRRKFDWHANLAVGYAKQIETMVLMGMELPASRDTQSDCIGGSLSPSIGEGRDKSRKGIKK